MKLKKEVILLEAFVVLNDEGLEKFNMRSLARALSVSATALYWHYKNKNELIDDMVNQIYSNAYNSTKECRGWQSNLKMLGSSLRKELELHRDSVGLIASRLPSENNLLEANRKSIATRMTDDGLAEEQAWQFVSVIISFVLGWMSYYQNEEYRELLSSRFDFAASFEIGLNSLISGFETVSQPQASRLPQANSID